MNLPFFSWTTWFRLRNHHAFQPHRLVSLLPIYWDHINGGSHSHLREGASINGLVFWGSHHGYPSGNAGLGLSKGFGQLTITLWLCQNSYWKWWFSSWIYPLIAWWFTIAMFEGSLEVKLPTIWTVEKQRWEETEEKRSEERRCRCAKRSESCETLCFSNDLGLRRVEK